MAILSSVNTNFAAANAREQLMNSQIKGTTQQLNEMGRYNALKKEAQANAELYNALYAKVKEAGIAAASRSSNLRVVDEARVLGSPTRPNRMLNLGGRNHGRRAGRYRPGISPRTHRQPHLHPGRYSTVHRQLERCDSAASFGLRRTPASTRGRSGRTRYDCRQKENGRGTKILPRCAEFARGGGAAFAVHFDDAVEFGSAAAGGSGGFVLPR